jgi:hypothetical protein
MNPDVHKLTVDCGVGWGVVITPARQSNLRAGPDAGDRRGWRERRAGGGKRQRGEMQSRQRGRQAAPTAGEHSRRRGTLAGGEVQRGESTSGGERTSGGEKITFCFCFFSFSNGQGRAGKRRGNSCNFGAI